MAAATVYRLLTPGVLGTLSVASVVVLWVASNFFTENMLRTYDKPFLFAYVNSAIFMVFFVFLRVPDPAAEYLRRRKRALCAEGAHQMVALGPEDKARISPAADSASAKAALASPDAGADIESPASTSALVDTPAALAPLTPRETARIALSFFAVYLLSNYCNIYSFKMTSVSSASILSATCGFFTLVFGWLAGVERMSVLRAASVSVTIVGVFLVAVPAYRDRDATVVGNAVALLGAVLYGVYSTLLKRAALDESRLSFPLLFAFGGLYTLLLVWPVLLMLHVSGIEVFVRPTLEQAVSVGMNAIFGALLPAYLWNVAFACVSPLFIAVGVACTIPLTIAVDYAYGRSIGHFPWQVAAALCILASFAVVNVADAYPELDRSCECGLVSAGILRRPLSETGGCFRRRSPARSASKE